MAMDETANSAEINRIQIQQVLVNLIRNAVDAVRGSALREIVVATALSAAGAVEVSVADTGIGLPGEVVQDLFKPFVTTKPDGMGIGLAICKSIIDAHGGTIWWDANPRGGTIFRFTLPKAAGQPASP
jgi:two-component system sensor kinase FixL